MSDLAQAIDGLSGVTAALFAQVAEATSDGIGITRDAFGEKETAAAEILIDFARRHGLTAGFDAVGNLNVTGDDAPAPGREILLGSHLDSVPRGGNFDGLAGVIAGALVLAALRRADIKSERAIRVLGFRGEESPWFGTAYLGSKLFAGYLTRADLDSLRRRDTGLTLAQHLRRLGVDADAAVKGAPQIAPARIRAYLELHIEQGPLLESLDCPLGIATALRGNIRYPLARCLGRYAHSAAVPRDLRRDAVIATAKLIAHADARWRALIEAGHDDLVFTCGILHTDAQEHAMTKVPGCVTFALNIGATTDAAMETLHQDLVRRAGDLAAEHAVRFEFGERVGSPAVPLDPGLREAAAAAGRSLGIPIRPMPTVGHDAAVLARLGVPAGVLLVRNAHGSHNPAEAMALADFMLGVKVLAATALRL
jgi:beta-ureidopropionase / N-carbamoyl-L-amino-acid hydrolase